MKSVCFIEKQPLILFRDIFVHRIKRIFISSQLRDCHPELAKDLTIVHKCLNMSILPNSEILHFVQDDNPGNASLLNTHCIY